jgi:hypothetical protein
MDGEAGLIPKRGVVDHEKREMWLENKMLRQIIADQALSIKVKDELLKKTLHRKEHEGK